MNDLKFYALLEQVQTIALGKTTLPPSGQSIKE
jgi:hypothetical protein